MNVIIKKSKLKGEVIAPPSKSYSHRYLIGAMLANNKSVISNIYFSDDVLATLNCIKAMGKNYKIDGNNIEIYDDNIDNDLPIFDCNESGSTLRFFIPIGLSKYEKVIFKGSKRLLERGISIYENILKDVEFIKEENQITIIGKLNPGHYKIDGSISSQYITGLLFALPLLDEDSIIEVLPPITSKNYIDMTLEVLNKYQIKYEMHDNIIKIFKNQSYIAINQFIEGDYSNAAFLDAFNYFNNNIVIKNLNPYSLQGDKVYIDYFKKLNEGNVELDIKNCIDLGPILFVFASLKHGATFINTNRLKIKESDRASAIKEELAKINVNIEILDNKVIVHKSNIINNNIAFNSHNDHRIAMALSLLATQFDITINDANCINKSYPHYFKDLKKLGVDLYETN